MGKDQGIAPYVFSYSETYDNPYKYQNISSSKFVVPGIDYGHSVIFVSGQDNDQQESKRQER